MKFIGNVLMVVGLIAGCLAAATAYSPRTSLPDERLVGLTMSASAGARTPTDEELQRLDEQYAVGEITAEQYVSRREALTAIVPARFDGSQRVIDEATLALLRGESAAAEGGAGAAGNGAVAEFVKVKEFGLTRWAYWWLFAAAAAGLGTGSLMVRAATKRELSAKALVQPAPDGSATGAGASPEAMLDTVRRTVARLLDELPGMPGEEQRLQAIVDQVGAAQRNELAAFAEARQSLVARLTLSGYAALMDRFATAERRLNRAWSAAADGAFEEAYLGLQSAVLPLDEARERLKG